MELQLYSYYRSSSAYRVRIALNLKHLKYEYKAVHLLNNGGEQNSSEFQKLNPKKEIPVLIHNERALSQSVAIIEYLDELYPIPLLYPTDRYMRSQVRAACEIINSGIQPLQNLSVQQRIQNETGINDEKKTKLISYWIESGLKAFEDFIKPHSKDFCFGNEVSAADLFLVPQIFSSKRFGANVDQFPKLLEIYERCVAIEAFKLADPTCQPDTPKES